MSSGVLTVDDRLQGRFVLLGLAVSSDDVVWNVLDFEYH